MQPDHKGRYIVGSGSRCHDVVLQLIRTRRKWSCWLPWLKRSRWQNRNWGEREKRYQRKNEKTQNVLQSARMNHIEENHADGLSIFEAPPTNTAILNEYWPTNQITEYAALEFLVPPQSVGYMDVKKSSLKVKLRLADSSDKPITTDDMGLVNLALHSICSQVDCTLQHTSVNQVGTNYPHRPIWTLYFYQRKGKVVLQSQLFVKDVMGRDDSDVNNGFRGEDFRNQPIRTKIACSDHVCKRIVMKWAILIEDHP